MTAVFVNRHVYLWKFVLHLIRFIAYRCHLGVFGCKHITFRPALVPATEHSYLVVLGEKLDEIFRVRGLSRSAYGDIAYTDDGQFEGSGFEHT